MLYWNPDMACFCKYVKSLLCRWQFAVTFPVGVGSGLPPQPMVMKNDTQALDVSLRTIRTVRLCIADEYER